MSKVSTKFGLAAIALGASLALAAPASAAVTIVQSAGPVQPGENVLTDTSMTGFSVFGTTNQTNTRVTVQSDEDLTTTASQGQARFAPVDMNLDSGIIFLTDGGTFTEAEFNLFGAQSGTTSVTFFLNGSTTSAGTFDLTNGGNFFGFTATGTDVFTSIAFQTNGTGVSDLRQLRLGGVAGAVPEPATWAMMLFGFGAVGYSMRRRKVGYKALQAV